MGRMFTVLEKAEASLRDGEFSFIAVLERASSPDDVRSVLAVLRRERPRAGEPFFAWKSEGRAGKGGGPAGDSLLSLLDERRLGQALLAVLPYGDLSSLTSSKLLDDVIKAARLAVEGADLLAEKIMNVYRVRMHRRDFEALKRIAPGEGYVLRHHSGGREVDLEVLTGPGGIRALAERFPNASIELRGSERVYSKAGGETLK